MRGAYDTLNPLFQILIVLQSAGGSELEDLRHELERVYDLCHGCRMCFNLCPAFPTLFGYADGLQLRSGGETVLGLVYGVVILLGVIVAAFNPKRDSRIAFAAAVTTSLFVLRRFSSDRS